MLDREGPGGRGGAARCEGRRVGAESRPAGSGKCQRGSRPPPGVPRTHGRFAACRRALCVFASLRPLRLCVGPFSPPHSYLSASIGSSFAALKAGKRPKKMPTEAENPMPMANDHQGSETGKPEKRLMV